jgi:hemoglobin-like flavoprotein
MATFNPQVIRDSFELAKPIGDQVINKFYETLWETYPDSKPLFQNTNMDRQKQNLLGSLNFIVENLENPGALTEYLKKLGARHIRYGVKTEHYAWVGDSLLKTFAHFFGDKWTPELQEQWTNAYGAVVDLMFAGTMEQAA